MAYMGIKTSACDENAADGFRESKKNHLKTKHLIKK
jgi:hypothetical protein